MPSRHQSSAGRSKDRIDRAFQTEGFFGTAKTDSWRAMNAYNHGGLGQLVRQFREGRIEASYSDEDILEGLRSATASVLLIGYLLAKLTRKDAEAAEIKHLVGLIP